MGSTTFQRSKFKKSRTRERKKKAPPGRVKLLQSRSPGTRTHWINPPTETFLTKQAPRSQTSRKKGKTRIQRRFEVKRSRCPSSLLPELKILSLLLLVLEKQSFSLFQSLFFSKMATMESLIGLVNRIQKACTVLGDYGGGDNAFYSLWEALPSVAVVGGQVTRPSFICFVFVSTKDRV